MKIKSINMIVLNAMFGGPKADKHNQTRLEHNDVSGSF